MRRPRPQIDLRTIEESARQRMRERLEQAEIADATAPTAWAAPFRAAGGKHAIM